MKRMICRYGTIVICMLLVVLMTACVQKSNNDASSEAKIKEYYSLEDFQSLVLWESTLADLHNIAEAEPITMTSYGGVCEYPTTSGKSIQVKLYYQPDNEEWIVGAVELSE